MNPLLRVQGLRKSFGGLTAVDGVSFEAHAGKIVGLIGPNGAGKTTTFNCIAGAFAPSSGHIYLENQPITGLHPSRICHLGIARTFQIVRPFHGMNVWENVAVGAYARTGNAAQAQRKAREVLAFLGCADMADTDVEKLGVAALRRLEIARALATDPKVLLLDEMLAGLTAPETQEMCTHVARLRDQGLAIVMVEHSVPVMRRLCDSAVVLNFGAMLACGSVAAVLADPAVQEAYLGSADDA